jgi:UDP-N-acetylglucosamine:LPS N-acetylglucosamine transferase
MTRSGRSSARCLLVASGGGHLSELAELCEGWPLEAQHWVTFDSPLARALLAGRSVSYAHGPTNRSAGKLARNLVLAWRLVRRHRPRTIVTTGAGVAVPFCYVGRLLGCRIVYVECLSRVRAPSLTGRLVQPVAHDFYVQWPELVARYRRARYAGTVY